MGNKSSKPKTPFEVLKVEPTSTREEIRLSFITLIKETKRDSKEFQEIVTAYDTIKKQPPPLDLYSDSLLETNGEDLFHKIADFSGVFCPPFGTEDFFKTFSNFQCIKKFKNEEEKKEFVYKVKKITRRVKKIFTKREETVVKNKRGGEKETIVNPHTPVPKEFNCTHCKKGFRSTNQLLNHLKSKKHLKEINKQIENPTEYLEKQIEGLKIIKDPVEEPKEEELKEEEPKREENNNTPITKPRLKGFKTESIVFRTCNKCKRVFESRSQMVTHIRNEHQP